jgi:fumarate reductase flavoprotein subunit
VEAVKEKISDRFARQQALMPYEQLLPPRLRGRNERIDEPMQASGRRAA